ncbi:hypothetical protein GCM10029964_112420 [Kibdelosporangium lantanae]
MGAGQIFLWEMMGTAVLILLGTGVVANVVLRDTLGNNGGWALITFGWGFAVFTGASIAAPSQAHLNPAVTLGLAIAGKTAWADVPVYILGQMVGAMLGALLCWLTYKKQFDTHPEPENTRGIFCTGPTVRAPLWNTVTEIIGTFVLVAWILLSPTVKAAADGTPTSATPPSATPVWRSSCWSSASPSVARPATPSTPHATSARASSTPSCRSAARAARSGTTRGSRSWARSSAPCSPACCTSHCPSRKGS